MQNSGCLLIGGGELAVSVYKCLVWDPWTTAYTHVRSFPLQRGCDGTPHITQRASPLSPNSTCLASVHLPPSFLSYTICPGRSEHALVNLKAVLSNTIAAGYLLLFKLIKIK